LNVCSVVPQVNWPKAEPANKQSRQSNKFMGGAFDFMRTTR
jgi:hypothetical protein